MVPIRTVQRIRWVLRERANADDRSIRRREPLPASLFRAAYAAVAASAYR
jgi:hypothetical protein